MLKPNKTIGIVGGGQLGKMLTEAAIRLGYQVAVVDPGADCPAKQAGAQQIEASFNDAAAISKLAELSDYLTIEIEHINTEALAIVAKTKPVNPWPSTIELIKNKYDQKVFLRGNGFLTADFVEVKTAIEAEEIFKQWGKMVLKSKTEAYDGRGNSLITEAEQIGPAMEKFVDKGIYAEKFVNFSRELAVMAAKDFNGNVLTYPVAETVHRRNICVEVYAPAQVNPEITQKAEDTAKKLAERLEGAGMYGIEMFLDNNNEILINEIAPRVHNSGHYTMNMFDVSQFEQHIRAISGMELKKPTALHKACCMINILGERNGPTEITGLQQAESIPGVQVYLYGKSPTKVDRKMGHINAVAGTIEEAKQNAIAARQLISV